MEGSEWKPLHFNVKKWILIVIILINILIFLFNGILITKGIINGEVSYTINNLYFVLANANFLVCSIVPL